MATPFLLPSRAGHSQPVAPLLVCALGFGLDQIALQMSGALATIFSARPYALSPLGLSWLLDAIYIGGCLGAAPLGRAADRYGLRRVLRWTLIWLGMMSILSCLRDDPEWLSIFRILIGISLGAYPPLMIVYLTSIAPERERGRWILRACGLAYIATPISLFALRSLTVAHPAGLAGWRWLSAGIGLLALATASLFARLPEAERFHAECANTRPASAIRLLMGHPLRRRFMLLAALYFLYPCSTLAFSLFTGLLLLQRGLSLNDTLWYLASAAIWPVVATLVAARFVDRLPRRTAILSCCMIMLVAALLFFASTTAFSLGIALVMFGVGQGLYPTILTTFGAESFPSTLRATATAAAWSLNRLACLLIPITLLPLVKAAGSTSVAACVVGALVVSACLAIGCAPRQLLRSA